MLKSFVSRSLPAFLVGASLLIVGCSKSTTDDAVTFTPVIAAPEMLPDPSTVDRQEFDIELVGTTIHTVWAERRSATAGDTFDIWYSQAAIGNALADNAERVTNTAVDSRRPRLGVDSSGEAVITWEEGNSPARDIAVIRRSGGAFGAVGFFSLQGDANDDANPDLHIGANDTVHVVWERGGQAIYRQQGVGTAAAGEIILPSANGLDTSNQASRPAVITDTAGDVIVVWQAQQTVSGQNVTLIRAAASEDGGGSFTRAAHADGTALVQGAHEPRLVRSEVDMGYYLVFRTGKPGDGDFRVRVQRMAGFGVLDEKFTDVYQSSTMIPTGIDIDAQGDEIYVTWIEDGVAMVRVSVDNNEHFGSAVALSQASGPSGTQARTAVSVSGDGLATVFDAGNASARAGYISASDIATRNDGQ